MNNEHQWNIDNMLSEEDRATCERLAADRRPKPGSRAHFEEMIARCEAQAQEFLNRPFDEAEEAIEKLSVQVQVEHARGVYWFHEAHRQNRRNEGLTMVLWVAGCYGALMTALYLLKLWR